MSDEWIEKHIIDLVPGDDVQGFGVLVGVEKHSSAAVFVLFRTGTRMPWPAHGRVDVQKPVEVTVRPTASHYSEVRIDGHLVVVSMPTVHAEEYAKTLRGSAEKRQQALGHPPVDLVHPEPASVRHRDSLEFEADCSGLAEHLMHAHGVAMKRDAFGGFGVDAGAWERWARLHRTAHGG